MATSSPTQPDTQTPDLPGAQHAPDGRLHSALTEIERQPLPEGWHYTDEVAYEDPAPWRRHHRLPVWGVLGIVALAAAVGLLALNAQAHYARGLTALRDGSFAVAEGEFSSARLLVFPYRNAQALGDQARRGLAAQFDREQTAAARLDTVRAALDQADSAALAGSAGAALAALRSVAAADLRAVAGGGSAAQQQADTLAQDLTAAAQTALDGLDWGSARRYAAALLLLDPSSTRAAGLAAKAEKGRQLSDRLAAAQAAARRHDWRKALRLALAVTAARKDFPRAASLVAEARKALAPKPKPTAAATTSPPAATSGGSSSTTPAQPPPP